jgi:hypothetical protein
MSKFLVQKTVYLSIMVEGDTWEDAMKNANNIDHAEWRYDDEETPTVVQVGRLTEIDKEVL